MEEKAGVADQGKMVKCCVWRSFEFDIGKGWEVQKRTALLDHVTCKYLLSVFSAPVAVLIVGHEYVHTELFLTFKEVLSNEGNRQDKRHL